MDDQAVIRTYEIPIRIRALKTANIYVLESDGKKVLVDSGMGPEVDNFLKFSGEDVRNFDMILLSHMHIDHIGGAVHLRSKYGTPIAMGRDDISYVENIRKDPEWFRTTYVNQLKYNGLPASILSESVKILPALRDIDYYNRLDVDHVMDNNFKLSNNTEVEAIEVPGHSPGSTCLYLKKSRTIFTGDHILRDITPNISKYIGIRDSLGSYISSLKKLSGLDVNRVLPGHGRQFSSLSERVDELVKHHTARLDEVSSLAKEWYSPYEVARRMRWSKGRSMDTMNGMEKIFAIGEATTHLERLEDDGRVNSMEKDGVRLFKAAI